MYCSMLYELFYWIMLNMAPKQNQTMKSMEWGSNYKKHVHCLFLKSL